MKILEHGNPKKLNATKIFKCSLCGCKFEADKNEYYYSGSQYNEGYYCCKCPECGKSAYYLKE